MRKIFGSILGPVLAIVFATAVAGPSAAHGAIDISGQWRAKFTVPPPNGAPPLIAICQWAVAQDGGGGLAVTESGCGTTGTYAGTIDGTTGAMTLAGSRPGDPFCPTIAMTGSSNGFGSAFQLTFQCTGGSGSLDHGTIDGSGRCGNGTIDPGEQCDGSPCCTGDCQLPAVGTACHGDAESCTREACDAGGACVPDGLVADGVACTDGNDCTVGEVCSGGVCGGGGPTPAGSHCYVPTGDCASPACDGAGACVAVPHAAGTACDLDANFCTPDTCDGAGACAAGACSPCCDAGAGCVPAPATGCATVVGPKGAKLNVVETDHPSFNWTLNHGEAVPLADLGDPITSTDYAVCMYQTRPGQDPQLLLRSLAPAGHEFKPGRPSWRAIGSGFGYRDPSLTPQGLQSMVVKAGAVDGKTIVKAKGKGSRLFVSFSGPAATSTVLTQLRFGGRCVQSRFFQPSVHLGARGFTLKASGGSPSGAFVGED